MTQCDDVPKPHVVVHFFLLLVLHARIVHNVAKVRSDPGELFRGAVEQC